MNMYEKRVKLREYMAQQNAVPLMAAYDVLSAKLVEQTGFPVVYTGSYVTGATQFGLPDVGLVTMNDLLGLAREIAKETNIPIVCDCDTGWYHAANIWRTVHEFESAGVSGIHIEDSLIGKHSTLEPRVIEKEIMCDRIRACCDARVDKNFLIIARTEAAKTPEGMLGAVERLNAYFEAGADAGMLTYTGPVGALKDYRAMIHGPVVITSKNDPVSEEKAVGANFVIYWSLTLYAAYVGVKTALEKFRDCQDYSQLDEYVFKEATLNKHLPYDRYHEFADKYNIKAQFYKEKED